LHDSFFLVDSRGCKHYIIMLPYAENQPYRFDVRL